MSFAKYLIEQTGLTFLDWYTLNEDINTLREFFTDWIICEHPDTNRIINTLNNMKREGLEF